MFSSVQARVNWKTSFLRLYQIRLEFKLQILSFLKLGLPNSGK